MNAIRFSAALCVLSVVARPITADESGLKSPFAQRNGEHRESVTGGHRPVELPEYFGPGAGACCFSNEVCFNNVHPDDCALIGGTPLGAGLTCQGDPDGDGAIGCDDGCPFDPAKIDPGLCDCGVPDDDTDFDGVPDCLDLCPGTPQEPVNEDGCPMTALGACCFSVGVCVEQTTLYDCFWVGGVFQGQGSSCHVPCDFSATGDFDGDRDADLDDYRHWEECATGPTPTQMPEECLPLDLDHSDTVDALDYGFFQVVFTGCQSGCPPIHFTLELDNLLGTDGDNDFDAPLEFDAMQGALAATLQTGDRADGLGGTDTLRAVFNAPGLVVPGPILNFEVLLLNATADGVSLSFSGVTHLTDLTIEEDGTTNTLAVANMTGRPDLNYRGDNTTGDQVFDAVTYNGSGVGGTNDAVDIDVNNRGLALATGMSFTLGAITIPQIETLTFTVADGNAVVTTGITASTLISFTGTAPGNLNLGTVTGAGSTVTTVNCVNVVGNLTATFDKIGDGATILLGGGNDTYSIAGSGGAHPSIAAGAGNDTVVGTAQADMIIGEAGNDILSGGATGGGADVINGAAGTDTIYGGAGADVLIGGVNADTFVYDVTNVTSADGDTITDFTAGAGGDVILIDVSAVGGGIIANLSSANFTSGMGAAGIVAADNTIIVLTDTAGFPTFFSAETVVNGDNFATDDYLLIFFNSTSGRVEVYADADSSAAGGQVLLASFGNMTTAAQAAALVAANFVTF